MRHRHRGDRLVGGDPGRPRPRGGRCERRLGPAVCSSGYARRPERAGQQPERSPLSGLSPVRRRPGDEGARRLRERGPVPRRWARAAASLSDDPAARSTRGAAAHDPEPRPGDGSRRHRSGRRGDGGPEEVAEHRSRIRARPAGGDLVQDGQRQVAARARSRRHVHRSSQPDRRSLDPEPDLDRRRLDTRGRQRAADHAHLDLHAAATAGSSASATSTGYSIGKETRRSFPSCCNWERSPRSAGTASACRRKQAPGSLIPTRPIRSGECASRRAYSFRA